MLSRAKWRLWKQLGTNGARSYKPQRADLRPSLFWNAYVGFFADSASFTAHHSWGLVFAGQSVARSHQAFAKGPWT